MFRRGRRAKVSRRGSCGSLLTRAYVFPYFVIKKYGQWACRGSGHLHAWFVVKFTCHLREQRLHICSAMYFDMTRDSGWAPRDAQIYHTCMQRGGRGAAGYLGCALPPSPILPLTINSSRYYEGMQGYDWFAPFGLHFVIFFPELLPAKPLNSNCMHHHLTIQFCFKLTVSTYTERFSHGHEAHLLGCYLSS